MDAQQAERLRKYVEAVLSEYISEDEGAKGTDEEFARDFGMYLQRRNMK
jgi:hypothetical protein